VSTVMDSLQDGMTCATGCKYVEALVYMYLYLGACDRSRVVFQDKPRSQGPLVAMSR
jgi:hypothetical protein